ncbi:MAG: hypothetical protein J3Q66DRAFT_374333 [Benniella sp.]|nr:MAG: hypothetical protein J3Q66DRAFT_374333 [Benniella sp.]
MQLALHQVEEGSPSRVAKRPREEDADLPEPKRKWQDPLKKEPQELMAEVSTLRRRLGKIPSMRTVDQLSRSGQLKELCDIARDTMPLAEVAASVLEVEKLTAYIHSVHKTIRAHCDPTSENVTAAHRAVTTAASIQSMFEGIEMVRRKLGPVSSDLADRDKMLTKHRLWEEEGCSKVKDEDGAVAQKE